MKRVVSLLLPAVVWSGFMLLLAMTGIDFSYASLYMIAIAIVFLRYLFMHRHDIPKFIELIWRASDGVMYGAEKADELAAQRAANRIS